MAGHETSTSVIAFTLHLLATHPEITERLNVELKGVLGKRKIAEPEDVALMPFLTNIIKESMRLNPPGPGTLRYLPEDTVLGGFLLPKGTQIMCNHFSNYIL